jgi:hypothetical protein
MSRAVYSSRRRSLHFLSLAEGKRRESERKIRREKIRERERAMDSKRRGGVKKHITVCVFPISTLRFGNSGGLVTKSALGRQATRPSSINHQPQLFRLEQTSSLATPFTSPLDTLYHARSSNSRPLHHCAALPGASIVTHTPATLRQGRQGLRGHDFIAHREKPFQPPTRRYLSYCRARLAPPRKLQLVERIDCFKKRTSALSVSDSKARHSDHGVTTKHDTVATGQQRWRCRSGWGEAGGAGCWGERRRQCAASDRAQRRGIEH